MIRVVTQPDVEGLAHKLFGRFPYQLLQLIAGNPGCREQQLVAWMHSWLPLAPEIIDVRNWVSLSLDWFLDNGDIQKEPGGRYTCVPAYAIISGEEYPRTVRLNGDPSVGEWIQRQGLAIQYHPRYAASDGAASPVMGIERVSQINEQQHVSLSKQGFRFIDGHELEKILPRIDKLEEPDLSMAREITLPAGIWQVYNPRHPGIEGWQPWRYGDKSISPLVRWLPDHDQQSGREARYFFCYYGSQIIPLSYQQVVLWQFRLEVEFQPRSLSWQEHDKFLWLPLGLPSSFWQWLNLLARQPAERFGNRYRLSLEKSAVPHVRRIFQEHLGLRWSVGA